MAAIANTPLAGSTITYNGVQFGGSDAAFASTPPEYSLRGEPVYDDAGRVAKFTRYTLTVTSRFYATTEPALSINLNAVKERLSAPGKELKIEGLGIGFGTINNDVDFGPRVHECQWNAIGGALCWECIWVCSFCVNHCASPGNPVDSWMAFNYDTTWQNDFEGQATRSISGYVEVAANRANRVVADSVRQNINIVIPHGFRRVTNLWRENEAKNRLDFAIVDQQLPGEPPPPGIVSADARVSFSASGAAFNNGILQVSMRLKTAVNVAPAVAGILFIQSVLAKGNTVAQTLTNSNAKTTFTPIGFEISHGKFDNVRETTGSITWGLTGNFNQIFNACGIWQPVISGLNYDDWAASMRAGNVWNNRGTAGLASLIQDDRLVSLCSPITQATIGQTPVTPYATLSGGSLALTCPAVPSDGGWLGYNVQITPYRKDTQTTHVLAKPYLPGGILQPSASGDQVTLGGSAYDISPSERHITEFHGKPVEYVLVQYSGLRVVHKPVFTMLQTLGNQKLHYIDGCPPVVRLSHEAFNCPVWIAKGWARYRADGPVTSMRIVGNKTTGSGQDMPVNQ